jgi:hypothetical protein
MNISNSLMERVLSLAEAVIANQSHHSSLTNYQSNNNLCESHSKDSSNTNQIQKGLETQVRALLETLEQKKHEIEDLKKENNYQAGLLAASPNITPVKSIETNDKTTLRKPFKSLLDSICHLMFKTDKWEGSATEFLKVLEFQDDQIHIRNLYVHLRKLRSRLFDNDIKYDYISTGGSHGKHYLSKVEQKSALLKAEQKIVLSNILSKKLVCLKNAFRNQAFTEKQAEVACKTKSMNYALSQLVLLEQLDIVNLDNRGLHQPYSYRIKSVPHFKRLKVVKR